MTFIVAQIEVAVSLIFEADTTDTGAESRVVVLDFGILHFTTLHFHYTLIDQDDQ